MCRGGEHAVQYRDEPWLDWPNYWATGDASTQTPGVLLSKGHLSPNGRGVDGALLDLEYERIELIKFNLFDNSGTFETYIKGQNGIGGPAVKTWREMRLPASHPDYYAVGGGGEQLCSGRLIRHRTLTGICNDIRNPLMGASGQLFARNVQFDTAFPIMAENEMLQNPPWRPPRPAQAGSAAHQPQTLYPQAVAARHMQRRTGLAGRRQSSPLRLQSRAVF